MNVSPPIVAPLPLSDLMGRIALELLRLQGDGRALEDAIGRAILGEEPSTAETLAHLQGIDLIVQSLGELATYVDGLRAALEQDQLVDVAGALSRIRLRDLARNLSGGARQAVLDASGAVSGEVDLF